MADLQVFDTSVLGHSGAWPRPPSIWSFSSLSEVEECPLRYMLRRATYPSIWDRTGYPDRPLLPTIVGDVIHHCVEAILREFHAQGCQGLDDPCAVEVLKGLGGYSALIQRVITERLEGFDGNPRAAATLANMQTTLGLRVPFIRQRLQQLVSRVDISPASSTRTGSTHQQQRYPLEAGSHPEVELRAPDMRLVGRVDLLTVKEEHCEIVDYKTGGRHEYHDDQLRMYALLWSLDSELNPNQLPVERLVVSYAEGDHSVGPPSTEELAAIESNVRSRVTLAEGELERRPPTPKLPETCSVCSVRQMCDAYWESPRSLPAPTDAFGDFEVLVTGRNGSRSWNVSVEPDSALAILRTPEEAVGFHAGSRIRTLGVSIGRDDDTGTAILTLGRNSEVFELKP